MQNPGHSQGRNQGGHGGQQPFSNLPPHGVNQLHNSERSDNPYPPQQQPQRSPITKKIRERTFSIDVIDVDGERFSGTFRVIRPKAADQTMIASMRSQLCGGYYHDPQNPGCGVPDFVYEQAEVFAFLHRCVVEAPSWWNLNIPGGEVDDYKVVKAIYEEAMKIDPFRWRPPVQQPDRGGSGSDSDPQRDQSSADDTLASLVSENFQGNNLER